MLLGDFIMDLAVILKNTGLYGVMFFYAGCCTSVLVTNSNSGILCSTACKTLLSFTNVTLAFLFF